MGISSASFVDVGMLQIFKILSKTFVATLTVTYVFPYWVLVARAAGSRRRISSFLYPNRPLWG